MKRLLISLTIFALLVVPQFAFAQTKLVAVIDCNNADPQHTISVPDREGFSYQIFQNKCTWTKGSALEGTESKDVVNVGFSDARGDAGRAHPYAGYSLHERRQSLCRGYRKQ